MRQYIRLKSMMLLVGVAVIGGAAFVGLRHANDVRGDVGALEAAHGIEREATPAISPQTAGVPSPGGGEADTYLRDLREGDYTTYTHPVYGFSVDVPKEFELFRTTTADKDHTLFRHPRLPLALEINVRPLEGREESETLRAYLRSLSDAYDAEPPEGADGKAAAVMAPDDPYPGQYTRYFWFAHQQHLYDIQLHAPDRELLELWARGFLSSDFTLPSP
jgi:hypothetical protein